MIYNPKKSILTVIFVFIFGMACAKTVYVCPAGCTYNAISAAIDAAMPHDTVVIKKGVYYVRNVKITKPIFITGENGAEIDGGSKHHIFVVETGNTTIQGLKFCNTGSSGMEDMAGIRVEKSASITISHNIFDNCYFGIFLAYGDKAIIKNNTFFGGSKGLTETGNGIHCWKADSVLIRDNYTSGHRDGIYFEFVTNSEIINNRSYKNSRYGLHFMFSDGNSYRGNTFANNGAGVAVMYSKKINMQYNRFADNWGGSAYGLLLKDINDCSIYNNSFTNNTAGAYIEGSNRVSFKNNVFSKNGWAVRLLANCVADTFEGNIFTGNTFDFSSNGTLSNNILAANYWDKYEGYDLDRNGVGDVPYRPVSAYSVVVENVPTAMVFMRSFMVNMMDKTEKVLPSLIPENIIDEQPLMQQPL